MTTISQTSQQQIAVSKVLQNTYALLGLTVLFSALTCSISMSLNVQPFGFITLLVGFYGLLFLVHRFATSALGLLFTFAFTGFVGMTLAPLLNMVEALHNGPMIVATALGSTGTIFLTLSAYTLITKHNFNYLQGFLFIAIIGSLVLGVAGFLFAMPILNLAMSGLFILISSGLILFHTSQLIHGGERNYIIATISLYIALYNLFISLLTILTAFSGSSRD